MKNARNLTKQDIKMQLTFWPVLYSLLLLLTIVSCKKGDTGPAGPAGPVGATGVQGIQGPNGSQILSGSGVPSSSLGVNGDFYLDISTSKLYGPKTAASWGSPLSLMGATGANGATGAQGNTGATGAQGSTGATGVQGNTGATGATGVAGAAGTPGSKILSGTAMPDAALGADGDYFLDKTTYFLYGPKTGGAWGLPVNLQGPMGPQGATGATGATGAAGATGVTGATGATGAAGNVNVIYSAWMTSPYDSRDTTIDGTCYRVRHLDAPLLTSSILNTGTIITYFRVGSIGPYQLPYISDAGGATNSVNCFYKLGKIFVYRHTLNSCRFTSAVPEEFPGQPVMINLPQSLEYRYVIIPGGIAAAAAKRGVDLKNYEAARQYFKILN